MEYNIHQDKEWEYLGTTIGNYVNELAKVKTNPSSYILLPSRIPLNSQKVHFRNSLLKGLDESLEGKCTYTSYQKSNWFSFYWRLKMKILTDGGERLCFLYGNDVDRRLLFGDVPSEGLSMIEEVIMKDVHHLSVNDLLQDNFIDAFAESLMTPLAEKLITIDRLHRYEDNRIRFDLIFDDMRYRLILSVRDLGEKLVFPELAVFIED